MPTRGGAALQDVVPGGVSTREIEEAISQLAGLVAARIVTDKESRIIEIHGLANSSRSPKQIIRDIESTLMARWGIRIDHRRIGIAQVQDEQEREKALHLGRRLKIKGVHLTLSGLRAEARVELSLQGKVYEGTAQGGSSTGNKYRLVASATLAAVEEFLRAKNVFVLDEILVTSLFGKKIILVSVTALGPAGEESLLGGAVVKGTESEAVAKATMDAINRRVPIYKR